MRIATRLKSYAASKGGRVDLGIREQIINDPSTAMQSPEPKVQSRRDGCKTEITLGSDEQNVECHTERPQGHPGTEPIPYDGGFVEDTGDAVLVVLNYLKTLSQISARANKEDEHRQEA